MNEIASLESLPPGFSEGYAEVNGVIIHYVMGGSGPPLVLIHGWPQTWYEWRGVMPQLARRYTVVAVDMRGIGGSFKPAASAGYDARTMAVDVRGVMRKLGFGPVSVVSHDIGLLVAHAYAVTYPEEVERLVILEGLLVGIEPMWTEFARNPLSWCFGFNMNGDMEIVQSWDTARGIGATHDWSVGTTSGIKNKTYYLLDVQRGASHFRSHPRGPATRGES